MQTTVPHDLYKYSLSFGIMLNCEPISFPFIYLLLLFKVKVLEKGYGTSQSGYPVPRDPLIRVFEKVNFVVSLPATKIKNEIMDYEYGYN